MRHKKHHASLGVTREHREAMLSNLGAALVAHGRITTTLTKAKALRPWIEKIVTKAKQAGAIARIEKEGRQLLTPRALHLRRLAARKLRNEDALTKLFNETYKEFVNRPGGYTRIYKLGPRRISDAAELAIIEFVNADDPGYKKSRGRRPARKAAPAKGETPSAAPATPDATPPAGAAPAGEAPKPEGSGEAKS